MTAAIALLALLAPAAPPVVAFALEVKGVATVERVGSPDALDEGDALRDGEKLTVKPGGSVTLYFRPSGTVVVLAGPANATVRPGRLDTTAAVTVREVKVPAAAARGLERDLKADRIGGSVFRAGDPPPLLAPAAERAVRADRPTLRWRVRDGVTAYRVELFQLTVTASGRQVERKVWAVEAAGPELVYPAREPPLARVGKYRGRVTDGGRVTADSAFRVLDADTDAALAALAPLEASGDPADWRIAAEAYCGAGLTDEPTRLFERVAEKRPGSALVWWKLADLYDAAGRPADADRARGRAGAK